MSNGVRWMPSTEVNNHYYIQVDSGLNGNEVAKAITPELAPDGRTFVFDTGTIHAERASYVQETIKSATTVMAQNIPTPVEQQRFKTRLRMLLPTSLLSQEYEFAQITITLTLSSPQRLLLKESQAIINIDMSQLFRETAKFLTNQLNVPSAFSHTIHSVAWGQLKSRLPESIIVVVDYSDVVTRITKSDVFILTAIVVVGSTLARYELWSDRPSATCLTGALSESTVISEEDYVLTPTLSQLVDE